jgi:predicted enzyme related to lactoylglutathione lyase
MANNIVWVSIPVADLDRAIKFYSHVTGLNLQLMPGEPAVAVAFGGPDEPGVSFDLHTGRTPSQDGSTPYLAGNGEIQAMAARVVEAGGTILQEPQFMGDMVGWVAFFIDSEGNRIGIEQMG